ncbi:ribonuclease P protein component [Sphingorhabdus soli]|uniref:Ribonuclease P protein component n=1 Tax=Flavisphingopyxis soli TaxID=2601267 RepID=A0A5C6U9N2_9SPHN|nr:ribonuclease P protein component [Sphingorhabdus soli]TXC68355.1 ribonuclease P protein component [Sphingorhabdus soli]
MAETESASPTPALRNRSGGVRASGPESVAVSSDGDKPSVRKLHVRREFLAANRGKRAHGPAFVLLIHDRRDDDPAIGIGITVTKKVGNAVVRNRIKRRFRALARDVLPDHGIAGADHVLIGRKDALTRDFAHLRTDLVKAIAKAKGPR